ncbi:MAG: hypothetical protein PHW12_02585 [Smithella sp.]|nr:hypothetical protein [Smithella sp.]
MRCVTKDKVTVSPLTAAPVESVTVTVIILLRPPAREVGEAVIDDICRVGSLVVPVPLSVLPPQAIRQQNRNKEKSRHNCRNNFALITLIIITLLFKSVE